LPVITADLVFLSTNNKINDMRNLLSSYISIRILLSIVAIFLLLGATVVFDNYFHEDIILIVRLLVFSLIISPLKSLIFISYSITHDFMKLSLFSLSGEVIKLASVIVLFTVLDYGPLVAILAFVISDVLTGLLFSPALFSMKKALLANVMLTDYIFKPLHVLKNHAKWSVLQGGIYFFGQNIRLWIIQFFLGTQAVGIYGVAMGMFQHVSSLFPLSRVIAPIIPAYLDDKSRLTQFINSAIKYQLSILILFAVGSIIFVPFLINAFFPEYVTAYPLFVLLTLTLIPGSFSRIFETAFHALKLQKNLFTSNLVLFVMILIILPASIYLFGLYGIAVEFFITGSIYTLGRYRVLKKIIQNYCFPPSLLFNLSTTDRILFSKIRKFVINRIQLITNKI